MMKYKLDMYIDMTKEPDNVMMLTYHDKSDNTVSLHAYECPANIHLTLNQAFNLMGELQSLFRKVSLPLKERG